MNEGAQTVKTGKFTVTVDGKATCSFMKSLAQSFPDLIKDSNKRDVGFLFKDFSVYYLGKGIEVFCKLNRIIILVYFLKFGFYYFLYTFGL